MLHYCIDVNHVSVFVVHVKQIDLVGYGAAVEATTRSKRGPKGGKVIVKKVLFEDLLEKLRLGELRGKTNRDIADSLDYEQRYKIYRRGTMEKYIGEVMPDLKVKYPGLFEPSE